MKVLVTSYTFDKTAKTVTFTGYGSIFLDHILLITNVTSNIIIYSFASPTKGGTVATNVLTLTYDTSAMSNTDKLQIFYWDTAATQPIDDGSGSITVDGTVAIGAGSSVIGHVIADSGSTTAVTGNVTVVQGTATNLKVDASGVAVPITDNSGSLTVDNAGTFAVQATLAAETTKVIGTVNLSASQVLGTLSTITNVVHTGTDDLASSNTAVSTGTITSSASAYRHRGISVTMSGFGVGTVQVQGSFTGSTWFVVPVQNLSDPTALLQTDITANGIYYANLSFEQVRVQCTAYTSGSIHADMDLWSLPNPNPYNQYVAQSGTWNVGTLSTITNVVHIDDNSGNISIDDGGNSITVDAPVGTPVFARLSDGSAALIGQKAMSASLPVTLASDQASIPVASTLTAETTKVIGVVRNSDGAGNLITSNSSTYTAKFGLDANILGTLGTAFSTAGKVDVKGADGDVFVRQATASNLNMTEASAASILTKLTAGATTMVKLEDVASADGDAGAPAMAVRKATPANTSGTDGDYEMLQMNAGRLWVDPSGVTLTANATLSAETTKVIGVTRTSDGAGNLLTSNSTTFSSKFGLDANLLGTLGTAFTTAGKVDVKAADGDVFVRQATASNLNATVVGTGTFATQSTLAPSTSGGLTTFHLISAATTNLTNIKASAGQVYGWYVYNNAATVRKIAFHNNAGSPTAGASIFFSIVFPPNSGANVEFSNGIPFSTGIAISTVTGIADNDTVAVALNDLTINIFYK